MSNFSQAMRGAARELRLRGRVRYPTGAQYELDSADIVSVRISEGVDSGVLPGAVLSADCAIVLDNSLGQWLVGGERRGYAELAGAEFTIELGVNSADGWLYSPMGTYICEEAVAETGSAVIELVCHDGIFFRAAGEFADGLVYPCTVRDVFAAAAAQAGYAYSGEFPGGDALIDSRPEWNGASVRSVMGFAAAIAGCCVLEDRSGKLILRALAGQRSAVDIAPAEYMTRTFRESSYGPVTGICVTTINAAGDMDSEPAELTAAVKTSGAQCELSVSANPLFITGAAHGQALVQAMLDNVAGLEYTRCDFRWRGDPQVLPGEYLRIVDVDGEGTLCTLSRQTLEFSGGFSAECICGVPGAGELAAGAVSWNGAVDAGSLVGVIASGNIGANSITASKLTAGAVTAEKIQAGAVTAEKIDSGAIRAEHIAAGTITAESGIIANGAIGNAQIADGSITEGKIVSLNADVINTGTLSAERLVIVGDDGIIYRLNASSSGLSLSELEKEQYKNYINGTVIVARSITAAQIAAQTITGNEILAGSITAKEIDVSDLFAAEATIDALNAMDITGNAYLRLMVSDAVEPLAAGVDANAADISALTTRMTTAESKIEQTADSITLSVTQLQGEIDSIDVGGTNHLRNSGFYQGLENWSKLEYMVNGEWRSISVRGPGPDDYIANEVPVLELRAQNETGMFGAVQTVTGLRKNTEYIISGYIASHRCGQGCIEIRDLNATHWALSTQWSVGSGGTNLGAYDRFEYTFNTGNYSDYNVTLYSNNFQTDGAVWWALVKLEEGNRATAWSPHPEDPASGVKTSYIEIGDDHIDISTGGSLNVNSGQFNVTTGDFQLSLAKDDGSDVVMDIDGDGHTTFKAIHAGNVREAVYGNALFYTSTMGSLSALASYLQRTDARMVEYSMTADEYGSVTFDYYSGYVSIAAHGHKLPELKVNHTFSGTLRVIDAELTGPVSAYNGRTFLENCWFATGGVTGIYATELAEVRWVNHASASGITGVTMSPYIWARFGAVVHYAGNIPGGEIWVETAWVNANSTLNTISGAGGDAGSTSTTTVTGTLGYYGTSNGWHGGECFQGYSNAKGQISGCLKFDLSGVGTITTAKLTLHRKTGVGRNRDALVRVYGSATAWGSAPSLGTKYAESTGLMAWDESGTLDVTTAAQALKAGTISQLVLYTGETGVYDGKVYSEHYAQFDSASLAITYTT